jgi:hypothetical protein
MSATIKVPLLTGSKIVRVRQATKTEVTDLGIGDCVGPHDYVQVVELSSGVKLFALCDPEGNGAGHMVGMFKGQTFDVTEELA